MAETVSCKDAMDAFHRDLEFPGDESKVIGWVRRYRIENNGRLDEKAEEWLKHLVTKFSSGRFAPEGDG